MGSGMTGKPKICVVITDIAGDAVSAGDDVHHAHLRRKVKHIGKPTGKYVPVLTETSESLLSPRRTIIAKLDSSGNFRIEAKRLSSRRSVPD